MIKINWIIVFFISVLSVSCTKISTNSLYVPSISDVTANATLEELQQGYTLYKNNCGRCHSLYSPDDYSVSGWKNIISSMTPKTSMTSSQVTLVTKYVTRGQQ
jgi:hypothetical protein